MLTLLYSGYLTSCRATYKRILENYLEFGLEENPRTSFLSKIKMLPILVNNCSEKGFKVFQYCQILLDMKKQPPEVFCKKRCS